MNYQEQELFKNTIIPIINTKMNTFRQQQGWTYKTFASKVAMNERAFYDVLHKKTMPSLITFLLFISLMAEDERRVFIKDICSVVKEFKQQHLTFRIEWRRE